MKRLVWPIILALLATIFLLWLSATWAGDVDAPGSYLALALSLLFPIGLTLVAWSALPTDRSEEAGALALLAVWLALVGYLALGFGLHFGGAAFISEDVELQGLSRFFSLVRGDDSNGWGLFGLEGFFLRGDAATPAATQLFLSQLPLVISATLIVLLALPRRTPVLAQVLAGLMLSGVTYPLAGHWANGGGWLSRLGDTLALGHGLVDFAGAGTVFVLGGATALSASLVFGCRREPSGVDQAVFMPPTAYPLLASLGALLAVVGWIALGLSNPLYGEMGAAFNWPLVVLNGLLCAASAAASALFYSRFASGRFDPLMVPRGALAGLVAASAGAPFIPTWAALLTGVLAGLLLPLAIYTVDRVLRLDDGTAVLATYGLPGFLGLLTVAFFADGRWGQNWNGVVGLADQGVSGLLVASGFQADQGQMAAQVWGGVVLFLLGFLLPWGIFKMAAGLRNRFGRPGEQTPLHADAALNASGEAQSALSSLDRAIHVDDGN